MIAGMMSMQSMTFAPSLEQIKLGPSKHAEKQPTRLYIGGIPEDTTIPELEKFINAQMVERDLAVAKLPGLPVVSIQMNNEKQYAFVEVLPFCLVQAKGTLKGG